MSRPRDMFLVLALALGLASPAAALFGSKKRRIAALRAEAAALRGQYQEIAAEGDRVRAELGALVTDLKAEYQERRGEALVSQAARAELREETRELEEERRLLERDLPGLREEWACVGEAVQARARATGEGVVDLAALDAELSACVGEDPVVPPREEEKAAPDQEERAARFVDPGVLETAEDPVLVTEPIAGGQGGATSTSRGQLEAELARAEGELTEALAAREQLRRTKRPFWQRAGTFLTNPALSMSLLDVRRSLASEQEEQISEAQAAVEAARRTLEILEGPDS